MKLMHEEAAVLVYGRDPALLASRCMVLEQAGFQVVTVDTHEGLLRMQADTFAVLVLCHTLPPRDQQQAIAMRQQMNPATGIFVLTAYIPVFTLGAGSRFLSPFEGPQALIEAVREAFDKATVATVSIH